MKKIYALISSLCLAIASFAQCSVTYTNTNVSCHGGSDGTILLTPIGGTPPYSYLWAQGGQTNASITNLSAGSYTATVTDANACVATANIIITEPQPLTVVITTTDLFDSTTCNGTASATVSGGTAPYTYLWLPGYQTTATITAQCAGAYSFIVTDFVGCVKTDSANTIGVTTGIEKLLLSDVVDVFPNPSIGLFSVLFKQPINDASVYIKNTLGQTIFQSSITSLKMDLDMIQQPNGIYFVHIVTDNQILIRKILIQK